MQTDIVLANHSNTPEQAPGIKLSWVAVILLSLIVFLIGGLAGYLVRATRTPTTNSVEVGFARDMSIHHEQAVQMASLVYDRTEDAAIRSLAFDILTTQQGQIGIMSGWLDAWGVPWTSTGPRMTWMGMSVDGLMPGMATAEQMAALRDATGTAADAIFLQLMIPHHRAGVEMAQYALDNSRRELVRLLAQGIVEAQALEIAYMEELLIAKGHAPLPDSPHDGGGEHD
jgi:uncharacterized protein (DUF305 family)